MNDYQILVGDCRETLKTLPDQSVHCCVTSPPYFGLRDYGHDGQMGLEQTLGEYVQGMVDLFREVRRVLRDDGTLWLNMGSSYSSAVPNMPDCINRVLKGCSIFGFDAETVAVPAESVNVTPDDKRTPNIKLPRLFGAQGVCVEKRNDHFGKVVDFLAAPRHRRAGVATGTVLGYYSASDSVQNAVDDGGIVFTDLDANLQAKFTVLRTPSARPGEGDNAPFAVKETGEPRAESSIGWHAAWDSFAGAAGRKGIPNVDLVNQSVALRNGALSFACLLRDFAITHASEQKLTFTSVCGGFRLTVSDVRHLMFSFADGSLVPYRTLYDKATRLSSRNCAKQEIDTPNMVKIALQEDGWICRQTIIWHKPNPMPESVRDRCTKSHEYIFLMSKNARYWYDADAVREPEKMEGASAQKIAYQLQKQRKMGECSDDARVASMRKWTGAGDTYKGGRNKRSVWTVTTKPYKGAHFATFPPDLIRPCILAGCPEDGTVLDPFGGSGTTAAVAIENGRNAIICELNEEYVGLAKERIAKSEEKVRLESQQMDLFDKK